MKLRFLLVAISMLLTLSGLSAQDVALKTNLLYDATTTINLGAEAQIAPKWSLDLSGNFNGWTFSDGKRWKHWMVQPEARYWFCEPLGGHFTPTAVSTTSVTSTSPTSSAMTSPSLRTTAIRAGMSAQVSPTATLGSSQSIGTSKPNSALAGLGLPTTNTSVPVAARRSSQVTTTTSVPPRQP